MTTGGSGPEALAPRRRRIDFAAASLPALFEAAVPALARALALDTDPAPGAPAGGARDLELRAGSLGALMEGWIELLLAHRREGTPIAAAELEELEEMAPHPSGGDPGAEPVGARADVVDDDEEGVGGPCWRLVARLESFTAPGAPADPGGWHCARLLLAAADFESDAGTDGSEWRARVDLEFLAETETEADAAIVGKEPGGGNVSGPSPGGS